VQNDLPGFAVDPADVAQLASGIEGLARVSANLAASVEEHDRWQELDGELRLFDETFESELSDQEWAWQRIKKRAEPLYLGRVESWAVGLTGRSRKLDAMILEHDSTGAREAFRMFRRQADQRFYLVDKNLKALCTELRTIGDELDRVLGKIA